MYILILDLVMYLLRINNEPDQSNTFIGVINYLVKLLKFREVVLSHISRYPLAQIEDLYKLTYQAAFGSEHAVKGINSARKWLLREINQLEEGSAESLFDPISADGQILRVHLRPYLETGADPELLIEAFVKTANEYRGSLELLLNYWKIVEYTVEICEILSEPARLRLFFSKMEADGFPAVHHSRPYQENYNPHYRVVSRDYLPPDIMNL
jgi:hypothetical protein